MATMQLKTVDGFMRLYSESALLSTCLHTTARTKEI